MYSSSNVYSVLEHILNLRVESGKQAMIKVWSIDVEGVLAVVDGACFGANLVAGAYQRWLCKCLRVDIDAALSVLEKRIAVDAVAELGREFKQVTFRILRRSCADGGHLEAVECDCACGSGDGWRLGC